MIFTKNTIKKITFSHLYKQQFMSHKLNYNVTAIPTGMKVKHTILNGTDNY